jgi:hypothetical protein
MRGRSRESDMDLITITDLKASYHVVFPRRGSSAAAPRLSMVHDFSVAANHDDVRATIDYAAVVQRLLRYEGRLAAIESLAVELADLVLRSSSPAPSIARRNSSPEARYVSVRVERSERSARAESVICLRGLQARIGRSSRYMICYSRSGVASIAREVLPRPFEAIRRPLRPKKSWCTGLCVCRSCGHDLAGLPPGTVNAGASGTTPPRGEVLRSRHHHPPPSERTH